MIAASTFSSPWAASLRLREEFRVEVLGDFEEAVPLDEVGALHRGAHPSAPAFVVPRPVERPLDLLVERRGRELSGLAQGSHDAQRGPGELRVPQVDRVVVRLVERVDERAAVAVRADILHAGALLLPVLLLFRSRAGSAVPRSLVDVPEAVSRWVIG